MRRRDIKVNNVGSLGSVGRASCLGLLVLGMVLVNPVASAAYAEEDTTNDVVSSDEGIMTMAANASTVGISFSPTAGSTSLTPTTSVGQSAQVNVLATVNVANSGGYSVYVKSNTQNLVGQKSSANVIPGIQGSKTYANLATNTWGYYAGEGTAVPEGATYKAISVTGNGDKITENTNSKITSDTKKIMLSFAAKIGSDKPADTYKNTVTMSVVSSPLRLVGLDSITYMQDMTPEVCLETPKDTTRQLIDKRDEKSYWVAKLADNNCWMTQNLDLDIPAEGFISDSEMIGVANSWKNSDMSAPWSGMRAGTATTVSKETVSDQSAYGLSWDQGLYVIKNPTSATSCTDSDNPNINSGVNCDNVFQDVSGWAASEDPGFTVQNGGNTIDLVNKVYDAHYLIGNYYQNSAAKAGTSGKYYPLTTMPTTENDAPSSICPKGWRLPTSGQGGPTDRSYGYTWNQDDSFGALLKEYGWGGTATVDGTDSMSANVLTGAPLFFVRAGQVKDAGYMNSGGSNGWYFASIFPVGWTGSYSTTLLFGSNTYVLPSAIMLGSNGASVRCVAR